MDVATKSGEWPNNMCQDSSCNRKLCCFTCVLLPYIFALSKSLESIAFFAAVEFVAANDSMLCIKIVKAHAGQQSWDSPDEHWATTGGRPLGVVVCNASASTVCPGHGGAAYCTAAHAARRGHASNVDVLTNSVTHI